MSRIERRDFLRQAPLAASVGALLSGCTQATEPSGVLGDYALALAPNLQANAIPDVQPPANLSATEDNILGPYYRKGAPFRGKVTPPLEPGPTLVVRGRVWALDTRRPLAGAVVDVWQANAQGRYDNDDPKSPPAKGVFLNRARMLTDESGYYEYETIKPGRYQIGPNLWRPAHIHYLVRAAGYAQLVTQMYFKNDPMNARDRFIKPSLIIDPAVVAVGDAKVLDGTFDIVLAPEARS